MRRHVFVFVLCFIVVLLRRPDALFHAQFWAEDGKLWYAEAYNFGFQTLVHPAAGYFQTLPRLAALLALLLPLSAAPLLLNCIAIAFQILPAQFLMSSRCRELGSPAARALFAFIYLALPNSHEMHANITNAQWRVAFLALLVLFVQSGRTRFWDCFDFVIVILCAVTGPFIVFIAPVAVATYFLKERSRQRRALVIASAAGAIVQILAVLITGGTDRPIDNVREASSALMIRILAKQVFLAPILGRRTLGRFSFDSSWGFWFAVASVLIGIAIELYVLWRAPLPWKAFIVFAAIIFASTLATPTTASPQWPNLLNSGGVRYWFFPMLAFVGSLLWLLSDSTSAFARGTGAALLVMMLFGVVQDWAHPRPIDLHYQEYVARFSEAPSGAYFVFPLNPPGFIMKLMKH
jgi:hypothetical protein